MVEAHVPRGRHLQGVHLPAGRIRRVSARHSARQSCPRPQICICAMLTVCAIMPACLPASWPSSRSYLNDVWRSADGLEWTLVSENGRVDWSPRRGHTAVVFQDKM